MSTETVSPTSTDATSLPGLLPLDGEARASHARWSEVNLQFLDYVARNPEYLERRTFDSLHREHWLRQIRHQSWPLFMGTEQRREVERMTLGIDRLVKGVVQRLVDEGPARVLEIYQRRDLDERSMAKILAEPNGLATAPSRADYLENREGLKCLEYNAGGKLGGLQTGLIAELHLASAPVPRFLEAAGRRARAPDTLSAYFRHLIDDSARLGMWKGGDFNVAVVNRPNPDDEADLLSGEVFDAALQRVLAERRMTGGAFEVDVDGFGDDGRSLVAGGRPVHVVLPLHDGPFLRLPLIMFKKGRCNFISGPIAGILSDKRNLALLSEHARSDEFTAEERGLIERHIPWTRRVRPMRTDFRGGAIRLPDDLVDHREALVLKKARSRCGKDVVVGPFRTDAEWREAVAQAVREEDWIVQEYVEPVPYCFQRGERGAARHDLVWGLFAFGKYFGGVLLRMQPRGQTGVVNSAQGAEESVCLYVDD